MLTFCPFFLRPGQHTLLEPEIARLCAHGMGYELEDDPVPNARTYRSYPGLVDHIRHAIAALEPSDNIDIQTFMDVIGKQGYVAIAIACREKLEQQSS